MSGFEKPMISDRQREVVEIAKLKGVYQNLKKEVKKVLYHSYKNTLLL